MSGAGNRETEGADRIAAISLAQAPNGGPLARQICGYLLLLVEFASSEERISPSTNWYRPHCGLPGSFTISCWNQHDEHHRGKGRRV